MSITERFLSFIKPSEEETDKGSSAEVCSVCGNYRKVEGELGEWSKDKPAELKNHWENFMLIQDLVKEHLGRIKLQEGESNFCSCKEDLKGKRMKKPIKRHEALKPLSREHHHGLLLCWKIREGIKREVETQRIKDYIDWFEIQYLEPHFEAEEKYIFPVLGEESALVQRALTEHRRLRRLFNEEQEVYKAIHSIEEELDLHIRFEERTLFNKIQEVATPEQFAEIQERHQSIKFSDDAWHDHFWDRKSELNSISSK